MKSLRAPWGTADGVTVTNRITTDVIAECHSCGWSRANGSASAVRSAARRHAAGTGHATGVSTTSIMEFVPE